MKNHSLDEIRKVVKFARASAALEGIVETYYVRDLNKNIVTGKMTIE